MSISTGKRIFNVATADKVDRLVAQAFDVAGDSFYEIALASYYEIIGR